MAITIPTGLDGPGPIVGASLSRMKPRRGKAVRDSQRGVAPVQRSLSADRAKRPDAEVIPDIRPGLDLMG